MIENQESLRMQPTSPKRIAKEINFTQGGSFTRGYETSGMTERSRKWEISGQM